MPLLGAHMSIAGGLDQALYRGRETGCAAIQLFTKSRNQWQGRELTLQDIQAFQQARESTGVDPVAAHDSYLINLASADQALAKKSWWALRDELKRTEALGIPNLVMHPGAHLGEGTAKGLQKVAEGLNRLHAKLPQVKAQILLETTAGQGTNLGAHFEELAWIIAHTEARERLGICFDTCHAFAAGYDFQTRSGYERMLIAFDRTIGLDRLKLFHVNDSKKGLGSRVDRHEHPGKGLIGLEPFAFFLNDPRFKRHAFLLETPKGLTARGKDLDQVNLKRLKRLIKEPFAA